MSQENVEIVRRASEAIARGDIEDMLAYVDPEAELYSAVPKGLRRSRSSGSISRSTVIWEIASSPRSHTRPWSRQRT
jgi:hypothetical protein